MALLDDIYQASFRGATFLPDSSDMTSGRKTVVHEYPDKNIRFVEDLGRSLRTFIVRGTISEPNYLEKKLRLESALQQEGIGVLIHPFYGTLNVTPTTYTVTEDMTRFGVAAFDMNFLESNVEVYPASSGQNTGEILEKWEEFYNKMNADFGALFHAGSVNNKEDAANKFKDFITRINGITSTYDTSIENKNDLYNKINKFNEKIYININDPATLADDLVDILKTFDLLGETASERYILNSELYNFGSDDTEIQTTTLDLTERKFNRDLINSFINGTSLNNMFDATANIMYNTEEEVIEKTKELNENYNTILEYANFSQETKDTLEDIRNEVRKLLEKVRVNVNKIIIINTQATPVIPLIYSYYGDIDNYDLIIDLNTIQNPAVISGDIKILSS